MQIAHDNLIFEICIVEKLYSDNGKGVRLQVTFRDVLGQILEEKAEDEDVTVRESIARSIMQKAAGGDISAVKFLREVVDDDAPKDDVTEIRIHVVE